MLSLQRAQPFCAIALPTLFSHPPIFNGYTKRCRCLITSQSLQSLYSQNILEKIKNVLSILPLSFTRIAVFLSSYSYLSSRLPRFVIKRHLWFTAHFQEASFCADLFTLISILRNSVRSCAVKK